MNVVLARIDDRLIHGQVIVGWSRTLNPDTILLCNDEIASDPWQSRVYASSVPPQMDVAVLSREASAAALCEDPEAEQHDGPTILLTSTPRDMLDLVRRGVPLQDVNVGGMHYAKGKVEFLEFVWLDRQDLNDFKDLLAAGVRLSAQAVPGHRGIEIDEHVIAQMGERL